VIGLGNQPGGRLRIALVEERLALWWSPQQISGWLKETYPSEPEMWVSHETIYLTLLPHVRVLLWEACSAEVVDHVYVWAAVAWLGGALHDHALKPGAVAASEQAPICLVAGRVDAGDESLEAASCR